MALPDTVRVKLSSEEAGAISITPVVVREMAPRELVEHMLAVAGKDAARIREMLSRGTLVSGGTRFRWSGWTADDFSIGELLATFPDPDASRPFRADRCVRAVLRGGRHVLEIPRAAGARHGLLRRRSFWEALLEVAAEPAYGGYSYKHRADYYLKTLAARELESIRRAADLLVYSRVRDQVRSVAFDAVELHVER
jgi:hypothetical protein